ncbi:Uncharacterised protein [Shewanella morhuae]|uniref:Uncharacterized protein n=1 Tax=Shewanella morhuae TaxID=365591 RepID=A0A380BWE2_9GAMM|nr:Uncharacterised protein [Shewanella morhuae]
MSDIIEKITCTECENVFELIENERTVKVGNAKKSFAHIAVTPMIRKRQVILKPKSCLINSTSTEFRSLEMLDPDVRLYNSLIILNNV